ncbi:Transcriptional regulator RFX1 [Spathaspora sp. JA1]|nr:Transcriptional regulator RFX1 [Spathaspora sp. JA1]
MDKIQHPHHQMDDSYKLRQNQQQDQQQRQSSPHFHIQTKEQPHIRTQQIHPHYQQHQQQQSSRIQQEQQLQYQGAQYTPAYIKPEPSEGHVTPQSYQSPQPQVQNAFRSSQPPGNLQYYNAPLSQTLQPGFQQVQPSQQKPFQQGFSHAYHPPPSQTQQHQYITRPPRLVHTQSQPHQQSFAPGPSSGPTFQTFTVGQPALSHHHQGSLTDPAYPTSSKSSPTPPKRKKYKKQDYISPADQGETELKQLAIKAADIPLSELVLKIKQSEDEESSMIAPGSTDHFKAKENRERQRQLFGMVWLLNSCEHSPTAVVPRNRIYARYVQVCADNSLSPLSPASFGKLVRILFPSLTTRRLGMRGQSKYHYCGIKLTGDQNFQPHLLTQASSQSTQQPQLMAGFSAGQQVDSPISSSNSSISYDDSPVSISQMHTPTYTPINSPSIAMTPSIPDQLPSVSHMKYVPNLFKLLNTNAAPSSDPYTAIQLPSIYPYLPRDTDFDIADTLHSLYKLHVNSIFEALRFMQLKRLFASFNNFNSKLTAPAFKLYTNECIIEWVKQCDLIMYKKMIRMLNKLRLQFLIPEEQLRQLKQISNGYMKALSTILMNGKITKNFAIMKLKLAKHFVNLLNRLIMVIETGHHASRILNDTSEKQSMIKDWSKLDIPELVSREIPCGELNIETLSYILNQEVIDLLNDNRESGPSMFDFAEYISGIPGRFPQVNARLFLLLASNLLTTCLREISLSGGESFGAWWVVRCWTDEYLAWTVELGGFFQDDFKAMESMDLSIQDPQILNVQPKISTTGGTTGGSLVESRQIEQSSFPGDGSSVNEASEAGNTSTFDNSLGMVDLLVTSFEFEGNPQSTSVNMPSQSEASVNFDSNVENILNQ